MWRRTKPSEVSPKPRAMEGQHYQVAKQEGLNGEARTGGDPQLRRQRPKSAAEAQTAPSKPTTGERLDQSLHILPTAAAAMQAEDLGKTECTLPGEVSRPIERRDESSDGLPDARFQHPLALPNVIIKFAIRHRGDEAVEHRMGRHLVPFGVNLANLSRAVLGWDCRPAPRSRPLRRLPSRHGGPGLRAEPRCLGSPHPGDDSRRDRMTPDSLPANRSQKKLPLA